MAIIHGLITTADSKSVGARPLFLLSPTMAATATHEPI